MTRDETIETWPPEKARELRAMAHSAMYPAEHAAGRPHRIDVPDGWDADDYADEVRENCGACVLRGYLSDSARADGRTDADGPNYAGWARVYVECGRVIPAQWRAAFEEQRNSDNHAYAHALEVSINTYGVRWSDGLDIAPLTRQDIPDTSFYRRMADGHKTRMGHALTGYLVTGEEGISQLVRTCCIDK